MEIAARRSKICTHRKEDDGTRVHVETFVCCMHTSGVTNGLKHSALLAKLKTREERKRKKRNEDKKQKEKKREEKKIKREKEKKEK